VELRAGVVSASLPRRRQLLCHFQNIDRKEASVHAGHLSLINVMPAYDKFHLNFICDLLGVSLATYRLFHTFTGTIFVLFVLLHVLIHAASKPSFEVGESWQMFGLSVSVIASNKRVALISPKAIVCMATLLLLSPRFFRLPSYRVLLRCHQALAVVVAYALWKYISSSSKLSRIYQLHLCNYVQFGGFYHSVSNGRVFDISMKLGKLEEAAKLLQ